MVRGTAEDLRTVEAVLARLRPCCPRCGRVDLRPLTWYDMVIWFQCAECYKLWHQHLKRAETNLPAPMTSHSPTAPQNHSILHRCSPA